MAGDLFEKVRAVFCRNAKKTARPSLSPVEFLKPENEFLARETTHSGAGDYSAVLLSTNTEIRQLRDAARRLADQQETMLEPEFFLASLAKGWGPRVVTVYSTSGLAGILYTKERIISGIPTGIVYADASLGGILLGNPPHQRNVFRVALEKLLSSPRIRGVRLRLVRGSQEFDAVGQLIASRSFDSRCFQIEKHRSVLWKYHGHLHLPDTYDQFLNALGSTTRHNFRYYRRRFEASGHSFVGQLSMAELRSAVLGLVRKGRFTAGWEETTIQRLLNIVAVTSRPLAIGLRHYNGEWLSVIGGWYTNRAAVLCFQCNNERDFARDSLSVVLRAHLIDVLIRQGLDELVIWADTGPPLSRYVSHPPTIAVYLDVPTYSWRLSRLLISAVGPSLPKRLAAAAQWIT
jgi:hypothetical protein